MADPTRWLDDPNTPGEFAALVQSLDVPKPYTESAHVRIGSKVSHTIASAPVAAAAAKVSPLKLAVISGAIITGVGAIVLLVSFSPSRPPELPRETRPAVIAPAPVEQPAPDVLPPSVDVTEKAPKPKVQERTPPRVAARDDLAVEETLLEQARKASSPARALGLLREHERRFPSGALTAERLFLNAKVHSESGNRAAARRYATELERRFPASSYVARLRAILAEPSPEKTP